MWISERIAVAYFVYLAVVCWLRPVPARRRVAIVSIAAVAASAVVWVAHSGIAFAREWAAAPVILAGYFASGLLFVAPSAGIERWLMAWDRRVLGDPATRFARWPRVVLGALELAYMGCFVLIGAGFLILLLSGRADLADRYWSLVVAAEFGSFAPLAFVQTRPPWAVERKPVLADTAIHNLAARMVQTLTIRVNTFPSGHVAGSLAVAFAVGHAMPATGAVLFVLALFIALATIVGRYHYVVDGVAGAALAAVVWIIMVLFLFPHV